MDFFLTLPSNASAKDKTNKFCIRLPRIINLEGQWEAALVEMQYPYSWNNIHGNGDNWIKVTLANGIRRILVIPPGHYATIHDLLAGIEYAKHKASKAIAKVLKQRKKTKLTAKHVEDIGMFSFIFNSTLKRIKFKKDSKKILKVEMSEKLQYMLGFDIARIKSYKMQAKYVPDLKIGFYALYIYCSLVEPQIIGSVTAPLLRTVHVSGHHGDIVEKIFHTPHYVPVIAKEVDRVQIEIKDDQYQLVPFDFGKVVAKLHFRKKRKLL